MGVTVLRLVSTWTLALSNNYDPAGLTVVILA